MISKTPKGVMDYNYSEERVSKKHLKFRYMSRAYETAKAFKKFSPKVISPNILDFGSADGFTLLETHNLLNAKSSIGIEYSKELIEKAPKFPSNCLLIEGDVTQKNDAIKNAHYDLVSSLAILEHLEKPEKLFENAFTALKEGGIFIASCPSPFWDKVSGSIKLHHDEFHAQDFNQDLFIKLSKKVGFRQLQYRKFMSAPVGFLPYLKLNISPKFSHNFDNFLAFFKFLNWSFVNQLFVAQKVS
jgi:SAM-dependent methyltransferase